MDQTISAEMLRLAEHARAVARHAGARLIAIGDWCAQQTRGGGAHADHSVQ